MPLLTTSNTKTLKGQGAGYLTLILHLAPAKLSGYNVCPMATKGCAAACLNTAGRGRFSSIQAARIAKTKRFFEDRESFMRELAGDIRAGIRKAEREGLILAVRLNGTSDIRWETIPVDSFPHIFAMFPGVTFYDYTKLPNRRNLPANYRLTFSRGEQSPDKVRDIIRGGRNVAAVFRVGRREELPLFWEGLPVIDGDRTDLRFLDPTGVVVGLRAKGSAPGDRSGFVLEPTA